MLRSEEKSQGVSWLGWSILLIAAIVVVAVFLDLTLPRETYSLIPAFDCYITNNSTAIHIYHLGGDPLHRGQNPRQFSILVDGTDRTNSFVGPDPFTVGTNLSYNSSVMPKTVVMVYHAQGGGDFILKVGHLERSGS